MVPGVFAKWPGMVSNAHVFNILKMVVRGGTKAFHFVLKLFQYHRNGTGVTLWEGGVGLILTSRGGDLASLRIKAHEQVQVAPRAGFDGGPSRRFPCVN